MKTTRHAIYLALAGVIGFAAPGIAPATAQTIKIGELNSYK